MPNNVTFRAFKAKEIQFVNKHENGARIEFENKYSYNHSQSTYGNLEGSNFDWY